MDSSTGSPPPPGRSTSSISSTLLTVVIVLLVVLLIGMGVLAFLIITSDGGDSGTSPEPPPEGFPTSAPPPTQGPLPTPIPGDPASVLGPPTFVDTFDNADNWNLFNNECFQSTVSDGRFSMLGKGLEVWCWELTWPRTTSFYAEVEITRTDQCIGSSNYGLFVRAPDTTSGYVFGLTCEGRYGMAAISGLNVASVVPLGDSDAINKDENAINRIGILAEGDTYTLYANGQILSQVQDGLIQNGNRIGFFVRSVGGNQILTHYDNLRLWNNLQP